MFKIPKETSISPEVNTVILGMPGSSKVHHPWDDLKPCPCGCKERPLLLYKDNKPYFYGGSTESIFALCSICGRHTGISDLLSSIGDWNNDKVLDNLDTDFLVLNRKEFLLTKMQRAQAFDLLREMYFSLYPCAWI